MSVRLPRLRAVAAAGVLCLLAGCGSAAPQLIAAPKAPPRTACGTLRLAVHAWVGYAANLAVVSYLARTQLGCKVTVTMEPEANSWPKLANGQLDAILENWGHDDLKKTYIDDRKQVVEGGLTGNKGVIGWYLPPWMVKEYPDITDWRNLNKYAHLFQTPQSEGKGQLLDGDKSFVTNDVPLVKNLKLNYTVVFAGSEDALIAAFRSAERNHKPLIGYFYSPQWLLSEIELAKVTLPQYTPGCDADAKTVACDYQPYDLDKVMSAKFARSGNPAAEFIKRFQWTDDDQNQVARDIADGHMAPEDAAKKWLDAHPTVWHSWMPQRQN